ncbi:MAG: hypothetical protein ACRYFX_16225 [Janthinobacterium lividum]
MRKDLLVLPLCALLGCNRDGLSPTEQLPPATQTGANTLGCLLNGQPWTPQGSDGTSNYNVAYDPGFHGGNLDVKTYRLDGKGEFNYLIFGGDSISRVGMCSLTKRPRTVYFIDNTKPAACQAFDGQSSPYCRGQLTITRLDLAAGIVSGTFWFTLYKPGCDSVRITNGRFDRKL